MSLTLQRAEVDKLTIPERLELIGILWDSIAEADPQAAIPEWHQVELRRRRAEAEANPDDSIPWEEVRDRLTRSL
jgi:putative addiction module component (TIGR02574 family)